MATTSHSKVWREVHDGGRSQNRRPARGRGAKHPNVQEFVISSPPGLDTSPGDRYKSPSPGRIDVNEPLQLQTPPCKPTTDDTASCLGYSPFPTPYTPRREQLQHPSRLFESETTPPKVPMAPGARAGLHFPGPIQEDISKVQKPVGLVADGKQDSWNYIQDPKSYQEGDALAPPEARQRQNYNKGNGWAGHNWEDTRWANSWSGAKGAGENRRSSRGQGRGQRYEAGSGRGKGNEVRQNGKGNWRGYGAKGDWQKSARPLDIAQAVQPPTAAEKKKLVELAAVHLTAAATMAQAEAFGGSDFSSWLGSQLAVDPMRVFAMTQNPLGQNFPLSEGTNAAPWSDSQALPIQGETLQASAQEFVPSFSAASEGGGPAWSLDQAQFPRLEVPTSSTALPFLAQGDGALPWSSEQAPIPPVETFQVPEPSLALAPQFPPEGRGDAMLQWSADPASMPQVETFQEIGLGVGCSESGAITFEFTTRKASPFDKVGMLVKHWHGQPPLEVKEMLEDGVMVAWNKQCVGDEVRSVRRIEPGDHIVSVNGQCNVQDMMKQLRTQLVLKLKVYRPANSMVKMGWRPYAQRGWEEA